jgi:hypothetical protein
VSPKLSLGDFIEKIKEKIAKADNPKTLENMRITLNK